MAYVCELCSREFLHKPNYERHIAAKRCVNVEGQLTCNLCSPPRRFSAVFNLNLHKRRMHPAGDDVVKAFACGICSECFLSVEEVNQHRYQAHDQHVDFQLVESAHAKHCQLHRLFFPERRSFTQLPSILQYVARQMKALIKKLCVQFAYFRVNFTLTLEMHKLDEENRIVQVDAFAFRANSITVTRSNLEQVDEDIARACADIERNVEEFLFQGSGWVVNRGLCLDAQTVCCRSFAGQAPCDIHTVKYRKLKGVEPDMGAAAGRDNGQCFYNAVAASFCGGKNATFERIQAFLSGNNLVRVTGDDCRGVSLKDIGSFEKANEHLDLAVNVIYKDERGDLIPVYASKLLNAKVQIVLLLFHVKLKGEAGSFLHYAYIDEPEKMLAERVTDENGKMRTYPTFICWNCTNTQYTLSAHNAHKAFCHKNTTRAVKMPKKGDIKSFESSEKASAKSFCSAFMVFYDFEALLVPPQRVCSCSDEVLANTEEWKKREARSMQEKEEEAVEISMLEGELTAEFEAAVKKALRQGRDPPSAPRKLTPFFRKKVCKHSTHLVGTQPPFAYSAILVDREGHVHESSTYAGMDAAEKFVEQVIAWSDIYLPQLTPGVPMNIDAATVEEMKNEAECCYLCEEEFADDDVRCLDHDHLTGAVLGVAHNQCNLKRREQCRLSCFAHNFQSYDSHCIVRALNKALQKKLIWKMDAIPLNTQKFKSITANKRIHFLDSLAFLPASLSSLVDTLKASHSSFPILSQFESDEERKQYLLRKGVYPYSFATSIEKLRETTALPPISAFYNDINDKACSEEDYAHAQAVWKVFGCKDMLDYTLLYVQSDVYLLADVFSNFRNMIWQHFGLDSCQYLSLPHMSMDIMLKTTEAEIAHIHDQEVADLLRQNIRGGLSFAGLRQAERKEGEQVLLYLDANNLYGCSQRFPLPVGEVRFMTDKELKDFDPYRVSAQHTHNYYYHCYLLCCYIAFFLGTLRR